MDAVTVDNHLGIHKAFTAGLEDLDANLALASNTEQSVLMEASIHGGEKKPRTS